MRDWVTIAHNDEIKHLGMTTCLYGKLTGREPRITVTEIPLINFKEGVRVALSNELDAAEFYRDMYLATRDPEIRDIFFELMTDELEHSTRFAFIYNQLP
jgi:rubrerythrin